MTRLVSAVRSVLVFAFLGAATTAYAQNPIQTENLKAGSTEWQITNSALNHEIEGYASLTSVNRGGQISFFVNTSSATYNLDIFRLGWYGGAGGRRMGATMVISGHAQPACPMNGTTGMIECAWSSPALLSVPNDVDPTSWASGIYLAKLTAQPSGKQSYITFTVRDDARASQFLFTQNVNTYQAYNNWGGKSLYGFNSTGTPAVKVSFNRPYAAELPDPGADLDNGSGELMHQWEYPAVRWLERNGYDVTYATSVDLHEQPNLLLSHRAYLCFGHAEYWSNEMRVNVENASAQGVNMGFFGSNVLYWQIRYETSPVTGQADRTVVCYKGSGDPITGSGNTLRWRDLGLPEAAFIGVMYQYDPVAADIVVTNTSNWVFAGTGLHDGDHLTGLLGYEVDAIDPSTPSNAVVLGSSPYAGSGGTQLSNMTVYTAASGATVFASGSLAFTFGLDDYNAPTYRPAAATAAVQQMVKNLLAKFTAIGVKMSPAAASLTAGQTQQFGATVTGTTNTAVTWSVSPALGIVSPAGLYTAPTPITTQQTVVVTAASVADPTQTATAIVTLYPPSAFQPIVVNAGGAAYVDSLGQAWQADTNFSGGSAASTTTAITNTTDQTLYKSERWGACTYTFSVPNGSYAVTLKFAEIYFTAANKRLFSVAIDGTTVLSAFDIFAQAGGANRALDKTFTANVTTGVLTIQLIAGAADDPKISAIEIASGSQGTTPVVTVSPTAASLTAGLTQQFTATVTGTSNTAVTWSVSPAVGIVGTTGLYTAPGSITTQQTVVVTATSVADTTQKASATVTLNPTVTAPVVTMSPLTASLTAAQAQQFTATVTGTSNTAVTWSMSPVVGTLSAAGLYTAPSPIAAQQTVVVTATSVADTTKKATATVTLNPPAGFQPIFVNAGGPAYTDSLGQAWKADTGFSGGSAGSTASAITNTSDQTLYKTERWGASTYTFAVPTGTYAVTLKFAEIYFTSANQRLFSVAINGTTVLANFDIFTQAGGANRALDQTFTVDAPAGTIAIQLIAGSADDPKVSAIQILQGAAPLVATPLLSQPGGTYTSAFSVGITDATAGAQIYYTTDGSTPTAASTPYSAPVSIAATTTLKAVAILGAASSAVTAATYTFQASTPGVSPAAGTYAANQSVTLTSPGAQIFYTTNGTTPTAASTLYAGPISVTATTTVKAIAVLGSSTSAVASATYTLKVATPTFSVAAGTYAANQTVSLLDASAGAQFYYTTNGSTPTTSSTHYTVPIVVTATTTIKAIAVIAGWTNSAVASAAYTMKVATPAFNPVAGTYPVGQQVTLTDASAGALMYYTTNGATPTASSTPYTGPITLNASATIKVIAVIAGWTSSTVASAAYTIH